ncbi:type II toxin-antitoxin system HicA family toxin [Thermithiobacillus plumbiphilus]|uniref:Type II toxin-antitoxin system HicA family toxin n=1 Tax=Thermithiobacillus plumbiphilus TaxID=1729899 RepID=A0ABU9D7P1_9PROT
MNSTHRKTLEALFANPVNGNIEWRRVEALFRALDCRIIEGAGSSITVERDGVRAYFHRPHPQKEALKYRVRDAREFLEKIGETP